MNAYRSPWRWSASVLLIVAAAVHVPLIGMHLEEAPYIGVLFILLTVVCLVLAVVVVFADTPAVWLASGAVCFVAVVAFVLSRTVGLPQIGDDIGNWTEPMGYPAMASEALMAVLAALILIRRWTPADAQPSPRRTP